MEPGTPFLRIDRAVLERNIARMAEYAAAHGLGLRPHVKTHKSRQVARLQRQAGAIGLTVAKVGEAEVMAAESDDLLIGYPALDAHRTEAIARLAREGTVRVAVDSVHAADALAAAAREAGCTVGILVDIDIGYHRTGVQTPQAALELAQHVEREPDVRLDGLFCYPGHLREPAGQQAGTLRAISATLAETIELWRRHGLQAQIVSGGSTPSAYQSHLISQLTEIRPGTYVYNDMNIVYGGYCTLDDCAAALACTVVSDAVPGKVVLDAGTKTLTSDRNGVRPESGYGYIIEFPQAKIVRLTEEHGEVDISACAARPRLGQRVHVIPNHICPCVNLQDAVFVQEEDGTLRGLPVDARGRLS